MNHYKLGIICKYCLKKTIFVLSTHILTYFLPKLLLLKFPQLSYRYYQVSSASGKKFLSFSLDYSLSPVPIIQSNSKSSLGYNFKMYQESNLATLILLFPSQYNAPQSLTWRTSNCPPDFILPSTPPSVSISTVQQPEIYLNPIRTCAP